MENYILDLFGKKQILHRVTDQKWDSFVLENQLNGKVNWKEGEIFNTVLAGFNELGF